MEPSVFELGKRCHQTLALAGMFGKVQQDLPPQAEDISRPAEESPTPSTEEAMGPAKYTEEDLQRITKLCMESFLQAQGSRHEGPREGQLKARFPDL